MIIIWNITKRINLIITRILGFRQPSILVLLMIDNASLLFCFSSLLASTKCVLRKSRWCPKEEILSRKTLYKGLLRFPVQSLPLCPCSLCLEEKDKCRCRKREIHFKVMNTLWRTVQFLPCNYVICLARNFNKLVLFKVL